MMRTTIGNGISAAVLAFVLASSAGAQSSDTIIMRKAIDHRLDGPSATPATPTPESPVPIPNPSNPLDPNYYSWVVTSWAQSAGMCGSKGKETREVACKNSDGVIAADARCAGNGSGPKPIVSRAATITASCRYLWQADEWPTAPASCGSTVQSRTVSCTRSDGQPSDLCSAATRPASVQTVEDHSACEYGWSVGSWSVPANLCGANVDTRSVTCRRSDGAAAAAAACADAGEKPASTQEDYQTVGCATHWSPGEWRTPAPACGESTSTRSVQCIRADGTSVTDAECSGTRPTDTKAATDYTACTDGHTPAQPYDWTVGEFGAPSATCGTATSTRTVQCLDAKGTPVSEPMCAGVRPSRSRTTYETSSCTARWSTGEYGDPQPACGPTVRTRSVTCLRSDGVSVSAAACTDPRPESTVETTDHSACSFGWATTSWSAWSSSCGDATQSRDVFCQRSDGSLAEASSCTVDTKPASTQPSYQTSGCGISWSAGSWSNPAPACGDTVQTRTVVCQRSDGQMLDDTQCARVGEKPEETQRAKNYSTCTFAWAIGDFSAPSTTCGISTQNRSVTCQRSDGNAVSDTECVGTKPETTQVTQQVQGCSYGWTSSDWGASAPACGASSHSRTVSCTRSDGSVADASKCTETKPVTSEPTTNYATCTYAWDVSQWAGAGGCGDTVTQSRTVSCMRSSGDAVSGANCTATKPAATQTISDYSACRYSWRTVNGAWSNTCSSSATRTNQVTCIRSNGEEVDDSYCTMTKPDTNETQGVYSSCRYTPTYSTTYAACQPTSVGSTAGTQSATITKCTRSDGTDVTTANAAAGYANCPASTSKSCSVTYQATYGTTYDTCVGGTQTAPITSCTATGTDGQSRAVANAYCPSQTTSRTCAMPAVGTCQFANYTFVFPTDGSLPKHTTLGAMSKTAALAQAKSICESMPGVIACMLSYGTSGSAVYPYAEPYRLIVNTTDYSAYTGGACTPK